MLVLRELLLGPRRFSDLRADLPGISANVLTQRLAELEAARARRPQEIAAAGVGPGLRSDRMGPGSRADRPDARPLGGALARATIPTLPISGVSIMLSLPDDDRREAARRASTPGSAFDSAMTPSLARLRKRPSSRSRGRNRRTSTCCSRGTPTAAGRLWSMAARRSKRSGSRATSLSRGASRPCSRCRRRSAELTLWLRRRRSLALRPRR